MGTPRHYQSLALPAANSIDNFIDVVIAQAFIQRRQCRHVFGDDLSPQLQRLDTARRQHMIVIQLGFAEAPLSARWC